MPIAFANLGASANPDINDNTNLSSYSNSSWTPPTDGIIYVWVQSRRAGGPDSPTISGNGLTWVQIGTTLDVSQGGGLSLFGAFAAGSSAGITTVDFGANTQVHCTVEFFHCTGADETGTIGDTVVQQPTNIGEGVTSISVTLAAAAAADNRPICGVWHKIQETTTPRVNWTELDDLQGGGQVRGVECQERTDAFETTASASWATSERAGIMAAEIKAAVVASDRRGQISFTEFETPNPPRRGQISFTELEVPLVPRRGQISFTELEIPTAPRRGQISFTEFETPTPPRRGQISFTEFETPNPPRRGQISFTELQIPTAPRRGQISFAELEIPTAPRRGQVSFTEFETPNPPRRGQISFTELEVPAAPRRGQISFTELEVPIAARRGRISFAEFELPFVPTRGQISFTEFELLSAEDLLAGVFGWWW